jgi:hypothetical protein
LHIYESLVELEPDNIAESMLQMPSKGLLNNLAEGMLSPRRVWSQNPALAYDQVSSGSVNFVGRSI